MATDPPAAHAQRTGLRAAFASWPLAAVTLLSFSSGLPLGIVVGAVPAWLTEVGLDIRLIGLLTLARAPWSFKFLWAPLLDRFSVGVLGRKRGWVLLSQVVLVVLGVALALTDRGGTPVVWVVGVLALATAVAGASQDIAYDGYAVEVLRREDHAVAVGSRAVFYRAAYVLAGGYIITLAAQSSWRIALLAAAACYLPCMVVTAFAPEPQSPPAPPRTLGDAVWGPLLGFLRQERSLEILGFVILYKLSDNLTQALVTPFLLQMGFDAFDVGVSGTTIRVAAALVGTLLGGLLTQRVGLGRALWICGFLQLASNLGYAAVAMAGINRPVMFAAQAFEFGASGMGAGAFGVFLLRLTDRRFSATQYALFSSLFAIPAVVAGAPAAYLAHAIGWRDFFVATVLAGVPGLVMLARFVRWGEREPVLQAVAAPRLRVRRTGREIRWKGTAAFAIGLALSVATIAGLDALRDLRERGATSFFAHCGSVFVPTDLTSWIALAGVLSVAALAGLGTAAALYARSDLGPAELESPLGGDPK